MVRPTLGSRTAKEQNRKEAVNMLLLLLLLLLLLPLLLMLVLAVRPDPVYC